MPNQPSFDFPSEFYPLILESLREGILVSNLEGRILFCNRAMEEITGYSREELLGGDVFKILLPPSQHEQLRAKLAERAQGKAERYTLGYVNKRGDYRWAEIKASPYWDDSGQVVGSITAISDVTPNYLAKAAREESEQRYLDLFENMYDPLFILDIHGQIQHINQAGLQSLENEMAVLPQDFRHWILPEDRVLFEAAFEEIKTQGFISKLCLRMVTPQGNIRYWQINSTAIMYKGAMTGTRNIARDITEDKRFEWKQKAEEAIYRAIFEKNFLAIGVSDADYRIVYANPAFAKLLGYSEVELIGLHISTITHQEDMPLSQELFTGLSLRAIPHYAIKKRYRHKAGHYVQAKAYVSGVFDKMGKLVYSVATIEDVTEKKRNEEALIKAKQVAEHARAAERLFLANMSHEIRTPMNAVIGMTHLLMQTNPSEEQLEYLQALQFSADSLIGIITNILDISKIEANEIEFESRPFSLRQLLLSLQKTFQLKVRDKSISVVIFLDPALKQQLIGDQVRLNQILTNLLGNAAKFTHVGTIGIAARLIDCKDRQALIEFKVHDTGIGISKESLRIIFDNFKQADNQTQREFGGTGLGLSIVKQLVELQGGEIRVESQVQKGSSFIISLPFLLSEIMDEDILAEPQPLKTVKEEKTLQSLKILVAEDNPMNQKLVSRFLENWGCQYQIAHNGQEALQFCEQESFDVILMDVHMPLMDGCEATKAIRALTANPNAQIPIIALTAAALLDEKNRVMEAGMNEFLTKPFSPKILRAILLKYAAEANPKPNLLMDLTYLMELSGGDRGFILEILETFLTELPGDMQLLRGATQAEDAQALYKIAHRLKSSLQMLGLEQARELAFQLEQQTRYQAEAKEVWLSTATQFLDMLGQAEGLAQQKIAELKP